MQVNDRVQLIKPNTTDRMLLGTECRNATGTVIEINKVHIKDISTNKSYWKTIVSVKYDNFKEIGNHEIKQLKLIEQEEQDLHKVNIKHKSKSIIWTGLNLKELIDVIGLHPSLHDLEFEEYEDLVQRKGLTICNNGEWRNVNIGDALIVTENQLGESNIYIFTNKAIENILNDIHSF